MPHATITGLNIYPVKSCRGIALQAATIGRAGFELDRHWMVTNEAGRFLTQREVPRLALIVPSLEGRELTLEAPGMSPLRVPSVAGAPSLEVTIWGDKAPASDAGGEVATWLSSFLERPVRLVAFDPDGVRPTKKEWTQDEEALNEFSDGFPFLVTSQASLDDLNTRLAERLPMNRFRPNVVIDGVEAYAEDRIHELSGDGVRLRLAKPCDRCKITTTNQLTAEVSPADEPLVTLKSYRWSKELRGVLFGQNGFAVDGRGSTLRVGQKLEIAWK
jgi:uncharacterized protein YcbX